MQIQAQPQNNLTSLFDLCRQVIPYLDGKIEPQKPKAWRALPLLNKQKNNWLMGNNNDDLIINSLIQDLHQLHPCAGKTYYMTRTWELLCWQPMYISFIAIYGLKQLPDFSHFKQKYQHKSVYSFAFDNHQFSEASTEQLISLASQQLKDLFEHYRQLLDALIPCRQGYTNRLTADLILSILIKVSELVPSFTAQDVKQHAQLWLKAMELPSRLVNTLQISTDETITHARTSCCLTYKANNDTCINCPKKHRLRQKKNEA